MKKGLVFLAALALALASALPLHHSAPAHAAEGDLYPPGTTYWATTYGGHANFHEWPNVSREYIVDLHAATDAEGTTLGNAGNLRLPVHAPGDGTVEQVSEGYGGGWGNSIIWTSADGREEIHVAHLDGVAKIGPVRGGELVAYQGSTGYSSPSDFNHLHVSRRVDGQMAPVELSGLNLEPDPSATSRGSQRLYTAKPVPITPTPVPETAFGADRILAALDLARSEHTGPVQTVVISTDEAVTDALAGAPLAGVFDAPILLTNTDALHNPVRLELERLNPARVVVVGLNDSAERAVRNAVPLANVTGVVKTSRI